MVKYFLHVSSVNDSPVIALRYNADKQEFTVGGRTRHEDTMEDILATFFPIADDSVNRKKYTRRLVQKNKVQFTITELPGADAFRILGEMRKAGLTLVRTTNFGNLMR